MRERRDLAAILLATFISWMGLRVTAIAVPLAALQQTHSAWATGLVAGSAGLPVVTSGWWAARGRHRITSGPALAGVLGAEALGLLIVPVTASTGALSVLTLCAGGLVTGAATALGGPAQRAVIADIGDRFGPGRAARALVWQDLAHRISMIIGPPVGAWGVTLIGTLPLLWAESAAVGASALLVVFVGNYGSVGTPGAVGEPAETGGPPAVRPSGMVDVLRKHPDIARGVLLAAVGGFAWFGFSLGLAILGARTGRPGALIGAGMTGYGAGSLVGAAVASLVIARLPRMATMVAGWVLLGGAFVVVPAASGSLLWLAVMSAVGGVGVPPAIAALNALISETTEGADRRTAFAAEQVMHTGAGSLGMLAGGAVIGMLGAAETLVATGLLQIVLPLCLVAHRFAHRPGPPPTAAAAASGTGCRARICD